MKEHSKELVLGALLVAIAVTVWVNLGRDAGPGDGAAGRGAGGRDARVDLASLKVFPVDWAALTASRPAYDPAGRNIFQFGVLPPPTPPPLTPEEQAAIRAAQEAARRAQEEQARLAAEQAAAAAAAQQAAIAAATPPPPPKPVPPPVNYKFIGYIGPPERKIAVLHDGTDLLFVRQGEVIGRNFRILEIGYESIKFGYTDPQFKGQSTTLPMSSSY